MTENKKWYSSTQDWLVSGGWITISAVVANMAVVGIIGYCLLYLPLQKGLVMSGRDQWMWNMFALILGVWVSYQFAKRVSKREVLGEAQATARSAMNRILQASRCATDMLGNVEAKLIQVEDEGKQAGGKCDTMLIKERFNDLKHQVTMICDTLVYAQSDWKTILKDDLAKQSEAIAEYTLAQEKIASVTAKLEDNYKDLARKNQELEEEKGAKDKLGKEKSALEKSNRELEARLLAERRKAATATREAPCPAPVLDQGCPGWVLSPPALRSSVRVLASGLALQMSLRQGCVLNSS